MLMDYGERCGAPLTGMGWANSFMGLGATAAQTRRAAALAKRQATQRAAVARRAAKKAMRVAGRNVLTSSPAQAQKIHAFITSAQQGMSRVSSAASAARTAYARAQQTRNPSDRTRATTAARGALGLANSVGKQIQAGLAPVAPTTMRGLGTCVDDGTGTGNMIDNGDGQGCNMTGGGGIDPTTGQPYVQQPYIPGGSGGVIDPLFGATGSSTGLVPGFGSPFGASPFGGGIPAPAGCSTGSNLPRCLIYSMAQSEQQQFYFVFSILQQMYAQLLQIVQQLMQQLQSAQQQPGYPYQGYGQYGQPPYDPNNPYGGYGGASPYGYGAPGVPYYPGGDTGAIPPGYGDGGGDAGMIPSDVSQIFPGPGPGPLAQGPDQASNIISSDGPLPIGAGPGTSDDGSGGGADAPVPGFMPSAPPPMVANANTQQSVSQPVNAGPGQASIVIQLQQPGQSSYADPGLPANVVQNQPSLEPPAPGESWAQDELG